MLVEGEIEMEIDGRVLVPAVGEEVFIPARARHSVRNTGRTTARWLYGYGVAAHLHFVAGMCHVRAMPLAGLDGKTALVTGAARKRASGGRPTCVWRARAPAWRASTSPAASRTSPTTGSEPPTSSRSGGRDPERGRRAVAVRAALADAFPLASRELPNSRATRCAVARFDINPVAVRRLDC